MLSFASVAITPSGEKLGEFEAVLERLEGAEADPETSAFWQTEPEAYSAATSNPQPPRKVMNNFVKWVRELNRDAIFVSHPVSLDGIWIDFYLQRFTHDFLFEGPWKPTRLFKSTPLCLVSFVAGRLRRPPLEYGNYPAEWLGHVKHTHRSLDDARGYANLLMYLEKL
jgi:hypothetical protein